jgi:hypothetical protein
VSLSLLLSSSLPICCHSVKLGANLGKQLFTQSRKLDFSHYAV